MADQARSRNHSKVFGFDRATAVQMADNAMAKTMMEKVADMTSDKVPDSWVASGATAMAAEKSEESGGPGMGQLAGMAGMATNLMGGEKKAEEPAAAEAAPAEAGGLGQLAGMAGQFMGK